MYLPYSASETLDGAIETVSVTAKNLVAARHTKEPEILFPRDSELSAYIRSKNALLLLTEGQITFTVSNKDIVVYEPGDLVGLETFAGTQGILAAKEFAVKVIPIRFASLQSDESRVHLQQAANALTNLFIQAFAAQIPIDENIEPDLRRYPAGDIIVEQNSLGTDIYTLVEGHAEVFVDGKKVGEVQTDEIFGALAAMTNLGRTATVISTGNSLVLSLKKEKLIELIKLRPSTVEKLIGDLARVISDLNHKLLPKI